MARQRSRSRSQPPGGTASEEEASDILVARRSRSPLHLRNTPYRRVHSTPYRKPKRGIASGARPLPPHRQGGFA